LHHASVGTSFPCRTGGERNHSGAPHTTIPNTLRFWRQIIHTTSAEELQNCRGQSVQHTVRISCCRSMWVPAGKASPKTLQNMVEQFLWTFIVYSVGWHTVVFRVEKRGSIFLCFIIMHSQRDESKLRIGLQCYHLSPTVVADMQEARKPKLVYATQGYLMNSVPWNAS
jgi:hypothetical protein